MENFCLVVYLSVFLPFLLCMMNRPQFVESVSRDSRPTPVPAPGRTTRRSHCHRHMNHRIEQCLLRFEQKYIRYRHENTTDPERRRTARILCNEYERTLTCLHYLLKSCPPNAKHLETVQYRLQLGYTFMRNLCFAKKTTPTTTTLKPSTVTSTSAQHPTTTHTKSIPERTTSNPTISVSPIISAYTTRTLPEKSRKSRFPTMGTKVTTDFSLYSHSSRNSAIQNMAVTEADSESSHTGSEQQTVQQSGTISVQKKYNKSKLPDHEQGKDQAVHLDISTASQKNPCSLFITLLFVIFVMA